MTSETLEIADRIESILDAVELEADRLRREAEADASAYSERARRHIDELVFARRRRISELSDELIAKSEAVVARLDDAEPVRRGFENLVEALGAAAERLAGEAESSRDEFAAAAGARIAVDPAPPDDYRRAQT